jgi:hypothetical protein
VTNHRKNHENPVQAKPWLHCISPTRAFREDDDHEH